MTRLKDPIANPKQFQKGDFFLQRSEGVMRAAESLRADVVTQRSQAVLMGEKGTLAARSLAVD